MAKFQGVDYYEIDSLLSEEERMVRDTVREWVDDNLLPVIEKAYIERRFPKELIPQMADNCPDEVFGQAEARIISFGGPRAASSSRNDY